MDVATERYNDAATALHNSEPINEADALRALKHNASLIRTERRPTPTEVRVSKLLHDGGIVSNGTTIRFFVEVLERLNALENSSATPPHMRAVEKRG